MIEVKHIDFKFNELGGCQHNKLRQDMSYARGQELGALILANLDKYVTVAKVDTVEPEEAYRLTNSIDTNWVERKTDGVEVVIAGKCRSTSIGDILIKNGKMLMVDSFGFFDLELTGSEVLESA
jgi:hypothetical protein